MFPLSVARLAINVVSSIGVAKIVGDIIKNNTVVVTTAQKVVVNTGALVLGAMLVDHASEYVNTQIDTVINWKKNKDENDDPIPDDTIVVVK